MPRSDEHHDERYEDGDAVESPYPDWDAYEPTDPKSAGYVDLVADLADL